MEIGEMQDGHVIFGSPGEKAVLCTKTPLFRTLRTGPFSARALARSALCRNPGYDVEYTTILQPCQVVDNITLFFIALPRFKE
jgi:hypothetical protein